MIRVLVSRAPIDLAEEMARVEGQDVGNVQVLLRQRVPFCLFRDQKILKTDCENVCLLLDSRIAILCRKKFVFALD